MKYKTLILFTLATLLCSCAGYRTTRFTPDSLKIGISQQNVIDEFGQPFKTDSYKKGSNVYEVFYYKEAVDVSSYTYILTTVLTFRNRLLIDIKQTEDEPPGSMIRTKSSGIFTK